MNKSLSKVSNTFVNFSSKSTLLLTRLNIYAVSFYLNITLADATCFVAHVKLLFPLSSFETSQDESWMETLNHKIVASLNLIQELFYL